MSLTAEQLKAAHWLEVKHLNFGEGGYGYDYRSAIDERVVVKVRRPKRSEAERRTIVVAGQEFEWSDWEGAAKALAALGG